MVTAKKEPDEIVSEYMSWKDKDAFIKFLSGYQKLKSDWDSYRRKIPDELLGKWTLILKGCRENGFIAPKVEGEKIIWRQIYSFARNHKNTDKCTLCKCTSMAGDCKGRKIYRSNNFMFLPCWRPQ